MANDHKLTGRADIHIHTNLSDGIPTAQQVLDSVAKRGHLDVIAITDHDKLDASLWAYSQPARYPFDIIPGVEVTAHKGHVLALWVTQPIPMHLSIPETVAAIHEQNGVAILAHPGEFLIGWDQVLRYLCTPSVLLEWGLDGVEVFNAGTMTPGNNILARRIVRDLGIPLVGNSDAHTLNAIGRGRTFFNGRYADDFRSALAAGQTAAEGVRWQLTDYLKLSIKSIPIKRNKSTLQNSPSTYPTA
ncbi:MAG: PHP domain-containing protein [Chloroflexi bacterium]|nr:PHP domain-containing protein [Chloroflexota bacterium]MCC6897099.1 phosphotransferase [Anaerolineae bacterium]